MGNEGNDGRGMPPEVAGILPEICRRTGCDDWRPMGRSLRRRDCTVHFLGSDAFRAPGMVLKFYRSDAVAGNFAANFHRRSMRCHGASTAEFSVPEPLFFMPRENLLAMEFVDAPSAGSQIIKAGFSPEARRGVIRKCARWLDWYQRQGEVVERPFDPSMMMSWIERLRLAIPAGRLAGDRLLHDCLAVCARLATETRGSIVRYGMAHGDFTPANLFVQGGRTIGFDYWADGKLPLYYEISRFLLYLEIYRIIPSSASDLADYGCHGDDLKTFIDAFGCADAWDDGLWLRLHFMEVTRRLLSLKSRHPRFHNRLLRSVQSTILRRAARGMMRTLGGPAAVSG